jgi:hypothetical protein
MILLLSKLKLQEEDGMAFVISPQAAADLRALLTSWCRDHGLPASLQETELLSEAVRDLSGQVVLETCLLSQGGRSSCCGQSIVCKCGGKARFVGYRKRWVRSVCGEVRVERAYYHCAACKTGQFPWDKEQGLTSKVSTPRLKSMVCHVMGHVPYAAGVELLERLCGVCIEESTAEAIVAEVGERVRVQEEQQVNAVKLELERQSRGRLMLEDTEPATVAYIERRPVKGKRLYLEVDAATANIDGEWHNVQHGIVFNVRQDAHGQDVLDKREYIAGQMDMPTLGWRMRTLAEMWNARAYSEHVFLGDGASSNWNIATTHFPDAIMILDFYHASQHVADLAKVLYSQDNAKQKALGERWRDERIKSLKHSGPKPLLQALKRRKCSKPEQREALRRELGYFKNNSARMDYPAHIAAGRVIGSGSIEAACKSITGARLKGTGMRWTKAGADAILAVRTTVLNGKAANLEHIARAA